MHIWSGKSDLYYYYYYFQKKENKMYQFCLHFMVLLQSDLTSKHQHEGSVRTKLSASEAITDDTYYVELSIRHSISKRVD